MNEREVAFEALQRIEKESSYATAAMGADAPPFVRELVLGVLRWRTRLDWWIGKLSGRKFKEIEPAARQILRLGFYQLAYLDVAPYAAVSETVTLAARRIPRAKGFINAVLRKATQTDLTANPEGDDPLSLSTRYSHPQWLVSRWLTSFGLDRTRAILESNQQHSYPDLLVNTSRWTVEDAIAWISQLGLPVRSSALIGTVLRLGTSTQPLEGEIERGLLYPMDEGSALVASLVPRGSRVLDLTAAPGGKTLTMLLRGCDLTSSDRSHARIRFLRRSSQRMFGHAAKVVAGDALAPPFRGRFEWVLLDAPCSAIGTFRKNPEAKWRLREEDLAQFSAVQKNLLTAALELSSQGVIYATCSNEPDENDRVVERVLEVNREFERFDLHELLEGEPCRWIGPDGVLRLTPEAGTDGFTAIALRRRRHS